MSINGEGDFKMRKIELALLIMGLLVIATACSTTSNNSGAGNNAVNNGVPSNGDQGNVAPSNTGAGNAGTSNIQSIAEINNETYLGKVVTVRGIVVNNVKIGVISGYRLKDDTGSIPISSQILPPVNSTVTVTGNIYQTRFFGLVINQTG